MLKSFYVTTDMSDLMCTLFLCPTHYLADPKTSVFRIKWMLRPCQMRRITWVSLRLEYAWQSIWLICALSTNIAIQANWTMNMTPAQHHHHHHQHHHANQTFMSSGCLFLFSFVCGSFRQKIWPNWWCLQVWIAYDDQSSEPATGKKYYLVDVPPGFYCAPNTMTL